MTTHASAQPTATAVAPDALESTIALAGRRGKGPLPDLTPILVRYWQEFPRHPPAERRRLLDLVGTRVRRGELTTRALVPIALGDIDEDIVACATVAYLGTSPLSLERRQAAVDDVLQWIRRGLALSRGAVFAALLCAGDAAINEGLAALRLLLTPAEIEVICRRAAARRARATQEFFGDWLQLLDACETPDRASRALIAAALAEAAA